MFLLQFLETLQKQSKLMKKKLHWNGLFLNIMRISITQMCMSLLFFGITYAKTLSAQELLEKRISLKVDQKSIKDVLTEIESEAQVKFVYSPAAIEAGRKVSVNAQNKTLKEVLDNFFNPLQIKYRLSGKKIVLSYQKSDVVISETRNSIEKTSTSIEDIVVNGTVGDQNGEYLPGVSIVLKGTSKGVISDINGIFKITVPNTNAVLVFSFVGYLSQEIKVGNQTQLKIILNTDNQSLDELIVVGYGTQKKADLTGSVATVDMEQLLTKPAADVSNMIQGRVAGVVASGSNQPGGEGYVRIRGISSFGSNEPLVIIDGVQTNGTNSINPNDIESMNILKDASSAAIYGARGAGGVIIITTKKGKKDKTRINYDAFYGTSKVIRYPEMLNTTEYGDLIWKQQIGAGLVPKSTQYGSGASPVIPDYILAGSSGGLFEGNSAVDPAKYNFDESGFYQIVKANKQGTDWFKEMTQTAPTQSHNLSASGGTDKSIFSVSLGYYKEAGIQKYTDYDRFSIRANSEYKISKRVRFGETLFGSYRNSLGSVDDNESSPWSQAYRMGPIIPVYDINNNFAGSKAPGSGNGQNPVAILYRNRNNSNKDVRLLGSVYAEVDIIKNGCV